MDSFYVSSSNIQMLRAWNVGSTKYEVLLVFIE